MALIPSVQAIMESRVSKVVAGIAEVSRPNVYIGTSDITYSSSIIYYPNFQTQSNACNEVLTCECLLNDTLVKR